MLKGILPKPSSGQIRLSMACCLLAVHVTSIKFILNLDTFPWINKNSFCNSLAQLGKRVTSIPPQRAEACLSFSFDPQNSLIVAASIGPNICTWCPRKGKGWRGDESTRSEKTAGCSPQLPSLPLNEPPGQSSANSKKGVAKSLLDEHSCTCSFWHLFIIKDNLTWMAGETAHLLLKIGFISFSHQYARAEWCFKNIPRHSANTGAFPYPTGQG